MSNETRATLGRINRKLAHVGQRLRKARGERQKTELGEYYIVDLETGALLWYRCDLTNV